MLIVFHIVLKDTLTATIVCCFHCVKVNTIHASFIGQPPSCRVFSHSLSMATCQFLYLMKVAMTCSVLDMQTKMAWDGVQLWMRRWMLLIFTWYHRDQDFPSDPKVTCPVEAPCRRSSSVASCVIRPHDRA